MAHWVSYVGVSLFPLLALFPFNVIAFTWGFCHGNEPMPPDLAVKSSKINAYLAFTRDIILIFAVLGLANHFTLAPSRIGLTWSHWQANVLIGVACGFLQIGLQRLIWTILPSETRSIHGRQEFVRARASGWVVENFISVFAQELWIAFSVVTLKQIGHSTLTALVVTAIAFAIAHLPYKLGIFATGLYGTAYASLFLWRLSLLPSCFTHCIGNIGSFYLARGPSLPTDADRRPKVV